MSEVALDEAAVATAGQRFRSGRVIGRMFAAVGANGWFLWPLSFVFVAIPSAGMGYLTFEQHDGPVGGLLRNVVIGLMAIFVQGVTIRASLDQFAGRRKRLGRGLSAGVRHFPGMFGVRFLTNLGEAFGLILLIVPGLIWMTSWCVAGPALIAEDTASHSPISRSATLTKGSRWPIFGLLLVFTLTYVVIGMVFGVALGLGWPWIAPLIPAVADVADATDIVATPIPLMLFEVFAAAGAASMYWELKLVREGGGAEAVSRVFA